MNETFQQTPLIADPVVAHGPDDAGHVRAVRVIVHRIAVVTHEIVTVDVVHIPVAVVIQAVAGDLAGIDPDVGLEVGMEVVNARVDDGHPDGSGVGYHGPRLRGADVVVRLGAVLAGVPQRPLGAELEVVGLRLCRDLRRTRGAGSWARHTSTSAPRAQLGGGPAGFDGVGRFDQGEFGEDGVPRRASAPAWSRAVEVANPLQSWGGVPQYPVAGRGRHLRTEPHEELVGDRFQRGKVGRRLHPRPRGGPRRFQPPAGPG